MLTHCLRVGVLSVSPQRCSFSHSAAKALQDGVDDFEEEDDEELPSHEFQRLGVGLAWLLLLQVKQRLMRRRHLRRGLASGQPS